MGADMGASSAWIVDEDRGTDPRAAKPWRRGFPSDLGWLPG